VQFVDGGIWTHNGRAHVESPSLLGFELTDGWPTHANVNGDWISVFFDGSGNAAWLNEQDFFDGSPRVAFEVPTGGPHHSGSATLIVNGQPFFAVAPRHPEGEILPTSVEVRDRDGNVVATVPDCPRMHGNSSAGDVAVFGCVDGLVLVRPSGSSVEALKVTPEGEMEGLGLRNAWSATGAPFIIGQFSSPPGQQPSRRVLALVDVSTGGLTPLPELPGGTIDHFRAVEPQQGQAVLLGRDGTLYIFNGSGQLQRQVAGVVPTIPESGATTHQVSVVENLAAVASPSTGEVVLVNLASGQVDRRINVGGSPSRLAILGPRTDGLWEME